MDRIHAAKAAAPAVSEAGSRFTVSRPGDAHEVEADRAATGGRHHGVSLSSVKWRDSGPNPAGDGHPESAAERSVRRAVSGPGQPLDALTRQAMESRLGHNFSHVLVHTDTSAADSARALAASAYTAGNHIAFAHGAFDPRSVRTQHLLAHELAHVVQQSAMGPNSLYVQRNGPVTPAVKRKDYVFLMGEDRKDTNNPFYRAAKDFYQAKQPDAVIVSDLRNMADLLTYIHDKVPAPIGTLYLVTHANEDGTVFFGLDAADQDARLGVLELRDALHPKTGTSALADVHAAIDAATRIEIKGCDLGRTQQMVELIDEAFGGEGTVTAPTHEQGFLPDAELGKRAGAEFDSKVAAAHPETPPIDPKLTGADKKKAQTDRADKEAARKKAIAKENTDRAGERTAVVAAATQVESLSGPMLQRPGAVLFTKAEAQTEVDTLYDHLERARRTQLVTGLIAPDGRSAAVIKANGVVGQHGQRVDRRELDGWEFDDPRNVAEAQTAFADTFKKGHFTPTKMLPPSTPGTFEFEGTFRVPGQDAQDGPFTATRDVAKSEKDLIASSQKLLGNPDKFAFRVSVTHHPATGTTSQLTIAERVIAYLHHEKLDAGPHDHFMPPETDSRFFTKSTFKPPPPPAGPGATPTVP